MTKKKKKKKRSRHEKLYIYLTKEAALGTRDALFVVFAVIIIFIVVAYFMAPNPDLDNRVVNQTTIIYDSTGQHELYEIRGEENRKIIPFEEIPNWINVTTIAAEDDRFYKHLGIDPVSIIRAAKVNIKSGDILQGGSTITQQLARNAYLTREKNWNRKFKEFILALKLEAKYSKNEIFYHYLNEVPYGSNAYGIQSAAETFFEKNASDLTLDEAAFLAALPKAPTYYSPYGDQKEELISRQKKIIKRLEELELADKNEIEIALSIDTMEKVVPFKSSIDSPHFVMFVREELERMFGQEMAETGGFKIITTLNYEMQKKAEEIVTNKAVSNEATFGAENAALVALDTRSGKILAMAGSRGYFDEDIDGQVNVTIRPRSPGSSFKPIVYAKAFEKGYQPESLVFDVKTNFGPDGSGKDYIPRNYDGNYHGMVSMRDALAMSLNIPAVKTMYLSGVDETIEMAQRLGINSLKNEGQYGLSLAIGGGDITLLEETAAYTVFATEGYRNTPTAIDKIIDSSGKSFELKESKREQVLDQEVARKINSVLSDGAARAQVFGSNSHLEIPGKKVAVKTGTTQEFRDAWTVGYTPSIAVGVWAGNNDNRPMKAGSYGALVAGSIWNDFMTYALKGTPEEKFADYQRVTSEKLMVTGNFDKKITYYNSKSGKKLSEKKKNKTDADKIREKIDPEKHEILFYVNRDDPLGDNFPNHEDPMLHLWEKSLNEEAERNEEGLFVVDSNGLFSM